ncbi:MAG: hypothetical protein P1S60_20800, partial [Anaerolineae bacterium]|nr:hypothetical protein [Anaerolineae bacterium]
HNVKIQREKLAVWAADQLQIPLNQRDRQATQTDGNVSYAGRRGPKHGLVPALIGAVSIIVGIVASVLLLRRKQKITSQKNSNQHEGK